MTKPAKKGRAKKAKAKKPAPRKAKTAAKRAPAKAPPAQPEEPPKDIAGRPSSYSREIADKIVALIIDANEPRSLRKACEEVGIAAGTFCGWVVSDFDGIADRYLRAQQVRAQIMADEIVGIADDSSKDKDGDGKIDHENIQRDKLRVDARKFILAKVLPKLYGDKIQHTGDGGGPVAFELDLSEFTDEQLDALDSLASAVARKPKG